MDATKVTAVGESEDTVPELQGKIDVNSVFTLVGAFEELLGVRKPKKLAIEPEMHGEKATVEMKKNIFPLAANGSNASALGEPRKMRGGLWLGCDGMQDVDAADPTILNERTERSHDSFYFWQLRHEGGGESRPRFEGKGMFSSVRFGSVAERGENGLSFIPVGKLVGIVAATRLPGLSRGYQENRFIPI